MIYLKFGSVQGDATQTAHQNWIQLRGVGWGMGRPVTNPAGSKAGRVLAAPRVGDLRVTKDQDSATIPLIQQALSGSPQDAQIDFVSEGTGDGTVYYTIKLKNAIITAFDQDSSGDRPGDVIVFNFTAISFEGTQISAKGSPGAPASYGWDVASNSPA
ncbi:Hcp family type VI secretion system effector [Rhodopila sp.]|jgi:type VI secretion system secreted protein Hcp|uniref:Hcp family type VI secretion system effector n=1 Tax=Rhodopila sp. TaxID=2480087 RepID=UPI002CB2428C|nr:type VI secretion system tube protein Hcp [Rhodopila sp.]HVZ09612.1 type VI secretion system tube protein Hcp [Rhodopila sp.]